MKMPILDAENPPWCPLRDGACKKNCVWRIKLDTKHSVCAVVLITQKLLGRW